MAETRKREMPVAFLIGAVIVALLVGAAVLWSRHSATTQSTAPPPLPMGAAEQAYAPQIKFTRPANTPMSRATNFLNQEVTYVFGTVENDGPRTVNQIEVTLEFHDIFGQVVLRDQQRLFPATAGPLGPGQQYDFQLSYEHLPDQWNQQYPTMTITGLDLK
ncbi:MAG: FxLYD domain-containing protein [Candidatus Acidiferrales bacterium]